jgi:hypothetical protein
VPPTVVAHGGTNTLGHRAEVAEELLEAPGGEGVLALEGGVQVGDVGGVVLVVVDPHRLLVDVRLQRVVFIGQRRQREGHDVLLAEVRVGMEDGGA